MDETKRPVKRAPVTASEWTPTKQMLTTYKKFQDTLEDFCRDNLKEGVDYGSIMVKGSLSKPSLFKPGAEKLQRWFQLYPVFVPDVESLEMLENPKQTVAYVCFLMTRQTKGKALKQIVEYGKELRLDIYRDLAIAEGRGAGTIGVNNDTNYNTLIKKAQKRAFVDAVLRVFGVSDRFAQDVEDGFGSVDSASGYLDTPQNAATTPSATALGTLKEMHAEARKLVKHKSLSETVSNRAEETITRHYDNQDLAGMRAILEHLKRQIARRTK